MGPVAQGANDSAAAPAEAKKPKEDVDVDALLAGGDNTKVTELKKVVVQLRRRPKRKPGESVVSAKSIKRMPGLAEADVIKSVQALPGVVASSDFSSKIYVRGGAADQNICAIPCRKSATVCCSAWTATLLSPCTWAMATRRLPLSRERW